MLQPLNQASSMNVVGRQLVVVAEQGGAGASQVWEFAPLDAI